MLEDAHARIEWAKDRAQSLKRVVDSWLTDPQAITAVYLSSADFAWTAWALKVEVAPPAAVQHLAGDFVAALRDALDYAAWAAFEIGGGSHNHKRASDISFPIVIDPVKLNQSLKRTFPLSGDGVRAAVASVQPCRTSKELGRVLDHLQELSNRGKHRRPSLAAAAPKQADMTLFDFTQMPDGYVFDTAMAADAAAITAPGLYQLTSYSVHREDDESSYAAKVDSLGWETPPIPVITWSILGATGVRLAIESLNPFADAVSDVINILDRALRSSAAS